MRIEQVNHQKFTGQLPNGWRQTPLEEVCEIVATQVDPKISEYATLPHVSAENIESGTCRLKYVNTAAEDRMTSGKYLFNAGDVLYSKLRPYLRKAFVADFRGVCSADIYPIKVNHDLIDPHFLAWLLVSDIFSTYADNESRRARMPKLNRDQLFRWHAPLPPISEQKRIAAILNEQLTTVERARAAAEAQLEAAKKLPAAYLREVFDSPEARKWPRKRLKDILNLRKEIIHPRDNPTGAAIFVGLEHIQSVTGERLDSVNVDMAQLTGRKPRFYKGDIVYGYLRPYLNKLWLAEFDGLCSVDQYVYKVAKIVADVEFVAWFMRSPIYLERAPIDTTPGQLPRIRTEEVASVELNLPSLREQQRVAAVLNERLAEANRLSQNLEKQLAAINALPAALLREAFAGRL